METNLFLIVIIVLGILIVFTRSRTAQARGSRGETKVTRELRRLPKNKFKIFNNVILSTKYGSSQIDHIVISIYGIFVIETKNYSGWIHGNEKSEYWTQSIYRKKTKFRNPVKQNWGHILALKEALADYHPATYHSIVVFAGNAELKNVFSEVPVIYRRQLIYTITNRCKTPSISIELVNLYADFLQKIIQQNVITKRNHNRQVKRNIRERKRNERLLICPKCSGDLVIRKGKYGKFYGCSNYPNCRYTRNIRTCFL
jgi:Nuclease-related domain/Topoisomerase DNA binding C4 zinc finger